ncbi:hypothetical protein [Flagellimonas sp.]|uniref:hypothetical protein n=1 Tax=Flagellimonas sp. TaxID=2058762 RepID=UPI003BA9151E
MRKNLRILTFIFMSMSLLSCGQEKMYIDEDKLETINIYNIGDELVFQNVETKAIDTSKITSKEIYHEDYDLLRHDGYQPHYAQIKYDNKKLWYGNESFMSAGKKKPNESYIGVTYLYSTFYLNPLSDTDKEYFHIDKHDLNTKHKITLTLVDKTFNQVVILSKHKHPKHKPKDDFKPQKLYWDKKYGIIKYETYGGDVWERINW